MYITTKRKLRNNFIVVVLGDSMIKLQREWQREYNLIVQSMWKHFPEQ